MIRRHARTISIALATAGVAMLLAVAAFSAWSTARMTVQGFVLGTGAAPYRGDEALSDELGAPGASTLRLDTVAADTAPAFTFRASNAAEGTEPLKLRARLALGFDGWRVVGIEAQRSQ